LNEHGGEEISVGESAPFPGLARSQAQELSKAALKKTHILNACVEHAVLLTMSADTDQEWRW